ncbi:MAG: hypothetical protein ABR540_05990 [Acidimicrobiales bacterium]
MAADDLDEARRRLEDEYGQVRRHLDRVRDAVHGVEQAGPEDDLYGLLGKLEDRVQEARTGGVIGSGAHGHRRALQDYLDLKGEG